MGTEKRAFECRSFYTSYPTLAVAKLSERGIFYFKKRKN